MKILIASTFYFPWVNGGAEISTQIIAEGLVEKGHKVEVVTCGIENTDETINGVVILRRSVPDLKIAWKKFNTGVRVSKIDKLIEIINEFCYSKRYYSMYKELLQNGNYDVAHASGNMFCMGRYNFWKAALDCKVPISQALRDPKLCHLDFAGGMLDKIISLKSSHDIKLIDGIVAPSNYMIQYYQNKGISNINSEVIYNTVDYEKKSCNFHKKKNQILFAGRIAKEKGIQTLCKAMEYINEECILILIGTGDMLIPTSRRIIRLNSMSRELVYDYMAQSKAVVLPSEWPEAFGRTIIEAIMNGTIAIGSDSGAIPEILSKKYVFKTKNYIQLANIVNKVLSYDSEEYEYEINALQEDCAKYSKVNNINVWENYFNEQRLFNK